MVDDWDPFADPADTASEPSSSRLPPKSSSKQRNSASAYEADTSLDPWDMTVISDLLARCESNSSAELVHLSPLEACPLLTLGEDEVCCAQLLVSASFGDVLRRPPLLNLAQPKGTEANNVGGGKLLAYMPDGCIWMREPLVVKKPSRFLHQAMHSVGMVQGQGSAPAQTRSADKLSGLRMNRLYTYVERCSFHTIAPISTDEAGRTLVRRSLGALDIVAQDTHPDLQALCDTFEGDTRNWLAQWAPCAVMTPSAPTAVLPALAQPAAALPTLTVEQALELQDSLIAGYSDKDFQMRLHIAWLQADGDVCKETKARQEVCFPIQAPVIERFGFEASRRGVAQSVSAFRPLNEHPEIKIRNSKMSYLVNPSQQESPWIESQLSSHSDMFENSHVNSHYSALRLPKLYRMDKELIDLARQGAANQMRLRIDYGHADPNCVFPDKLGVMDRNKEPSRWSYIEEKTPLIAAVESMQHVVVELLLDYPHLVDVNVVCYEWSIGGAYKRYTALDVAKLLVRLDLLPGAEAVVDQLVAAGARCVDEVGCPVRENPFLKCKEYFPDQTLTRLEINEIDSQLYGGSNSPEATKGTGAFTGAPPPSSSSGTAQSNPPTGSRENHVNCGPWRWPPRPSLEEDAELDDAFFEIKQRLQGLAADGLEERQRLLRQLFLEWHPDKRPMEQSLATKVFQWLQAVRDINI